MFFLVIIFASASIHAISSDFSARAAQFGNKTANLQELNMFIKQLPKTVKNVEVPPFFGISDRDVKTYLRSKNANITELWGKFVEQKPEIIKTGALTEPAKDILKKIRDKITQAFSGPHIFPMPKEVASWGAEIRLMVRSTGKEDTDVLANAGGNESVAAVVPTAEAISAAMGVVVASYFGERSMNQRLAMKDDIFAEPFMPVLIQIMMGEKDASNIPVSGVMYTSDGILKDVTLIHSAFGHNEGVVNSTVPTDEYYIGPSSIVHSTLYIKDKRVAPVNGKLALVPNDLKIQKLSSLAGYESVLKIIARDLEKYYNKDMDIEFTIDTQTKTVYLLQARPVVNGLSKRAPSYIENLDMLKSTKATVIVPATCAVRAITDKSQVVMAQTISQAFNAYFALPVSDKQNVQAVIIGTMAPATSHEAAQFSAMSVPVIYVNNLDVVQVPLFIDVQQGVLVPGKSASIKTGWFSYPIPLTTTIMTTGADKIANQQFLKTYLAQAISDDATSLRLLLNRLASAEKLDAEKALKVIVSRVQKSLIILKKNKAAQDLYNELFVVFNQLILYVRQEMPRALTFPAHSLERLFAVHFIETVLYQIPSLDIVRAYSLKNIMQEYAYQQKTTAGTGALKDFAVQYLKIQQFALTDQVKNAWVQFVNGWVKVGDEKENQEFVKLLIMLQKIDLTPIWLNKTFIDAWTKNSGDTQKIVTSLLGTYSADEKVLNAILAHQAVFRQWKSKISEWQSPVEFDKLFKQFNDTFFKDITTLVAQFATASDFVKLVILQVFREGVEVFDQSIKSVTGSAQYEVTVKIKNFYRLLGIYLSLMKQWILMLQAVDPSAEKNLMMNPFNDYIQALEGKYQRRSSVLIAAMLLPSVGFSVNSAAIGSKALFERNQPVTLEDLFTLMHQNMLVVSAVLMQKYGNLLEQLPDFVRFYVRLLTSIQDVSVIGIEYVYPNVSVFLNHPMNYHSGTYQINYSLKEPQKVTIAVNYIGHNQGARMDRTLALVEFATFANGMKFKKGHEPYIDYGQHMGAGTLSYTWEITEYLSRAQGTFLTTLIQYIFNLLEDIDPRYYPTDAIVPWIQKKIPTFSLDGLPPQWFIDLDYQWTGLYLTYYQSKNEWEKTIPIAIALVKLQNDLRSLPSYYNKDCVVWQEGATKQLKNSGYTHFHCLNHILKKYFAAVPRSTPGLQKPWAEFKKEYIKQVDFMIEALTEFSRSPADFFKVISYLSPQELELKPDSYKTSIESDWITTRSLNLPIIKDYVQTLIKFDEASYAIQVVRSFNNFVEALGKIPEFKTAGILGPYEKMNKELQELGQGFRHITTQEPAEAQDMIAVLAEALSALKHKISFG